jgi:hypothetical protein
MATLKIGNREENKNGELFINLMPNAFDLMPEYLINCKKNLKEKI